MTAWIETIPEGAASGRLKETYDRTREARGSVANVYVAQSLNPAGLDAHRALYAALFQEDNALPRRERELIAVVVSRANGSEYSLTHHADSLGRHSREPGLPGLIATDHTKAPLSDAERALLDHALKLTRAPATVTRDDVEVLRKHGYSDDAVLVATQVTAYVNFLNRVTNGLGVTNEDVGATYRY